MLEEGGSTGYTGGIGCTAPRSSVPNRRIADEKERKREELNTYSWSAREFEAQIEKKSNILRAVHPHLFIFCHHC